MVALIVHWQLEPMNYLLCEKAKVNFSPPYIHSCSSGVVICIVLTRRVFKKDNPLGKRELKSGWSVPTIPNFFDQFFIINLKTNQLFKISNVSLWLMFMFLDFWLLLLGKVGTVI